MNIFSKCLEIEVTKLTKLDYSSLALSKISKSALAGCNNKGVHSPHRTFFVRYLSMPTHNLYASCGGGHLWVCWLPLLPVC